MKDTKGFLQIKELITMKGTKGFLQIKELITTKSTKDTKRGYEGVSYK